MNVEFFDPISTPCETLFSEKHAQSSRILEDFSTDGGFNQLQHGSILLPNESISAVQMLLEDATHIAESSPSDVNIDNIQLYLECSDDNENFFGRDFQSQFCSSLPNVTSQITSDLQFRISFPTKADDSVKLCKCSLCKKVVFGKDILRDHVLLEHKRLFHFCQHCSYFTKSMKRFNTHMVTRHNVNVMGTLQEGDPLETPKQNDKAEDVTLENISQKEIHQETLSDHLLNESKCLFARSNRLQVLKDTSPVPYVAKDLMLFTCAHCPYTSHCNRLLTYHSKTMHDKSRKQYECSQCKYVCKQKRTFEAHKKKHEGCYDFVCHLCKKTFASKHLLTKHGRIHKWKASKMFVSGDKDSVSVAGLELYVGKANAQTQTKVVGRRKMKEKQVKESNI